MPDTPQLDLERLERLAKQFASNKNAALRYLPIDASDVLALIARLREAEQNYEVTAKELNRVVVMLQDRDEKLSAGSAPQPSQPADELYRLVYERAKLFKMSLGESGSIDVYLPCALVKRIYDAYESGATQPVAAPLAEQTKK